MATIIPLPRSTVTMQTSNAPSAPIAPSAPSAPSAPNNLVIPNSKTAKANSSVAVSNSTASNSATSGAKLPTSSSYNHIFPSMGILMTTDKLLLQKEYNYLKEIVSKYLIWVVILFAFGFTALYDLQSLNPWIREPLKAMYWILLGLISAKLYTMGEIRKQLGL